MTASVLAAVLVVACVGAAAGEDGTTTWLRDCEKDTPTPVAGMVTGTVPEWLEGRLTRVGGGRIHVGNTSYHHLFDPLALLHHIIIEKGQTTYTSKYLQSDTYKHTMAVQRIAVTAFGTVAYPDPCSSLFGRMASWFEKPDMGDNCLVNILQVTDEMMVMTETDQLRLIDPESLDTLDRKIKIPQYVAVQRASAHPHVDPNGMVYNMAASVTSKGPGYSIISIPQGQYEEAKMEATILARWSFNPGYMHSFAMTDNFFILLETPLVMNVPSLVASKYLGTTPEDSMKWFPDEQTRFRVIDRRTGQEHNTKFTARAFFTFHHINAYETGDNLVVDIAFIESGRVIKSLYFHNIRKDHFDPTKESYASTATRFVLPIGDVGDMVLNEELLDGVDDARLEGRTDQSASAKKVDDTTIHLTGLTINPDFFEMPRINYKYNGKEYRYAYGVGTDGKDLDFSSLIKMDMRTGQSKTWRNEEYVVSEPVFAASPDGELEDSGAVLSVLLHKADPHLISLLVLDAESFTELARVQFEAEGIATPTFHGQFVSNHDDIHGY